MPEGIQPNAGEQINEAELARRFEEKKRLLEAAGLKPESKEIFREAFREHVAEKAGSALKAPQPVPALPARDATPVAVQVSDTKPTDSSMKAELDLLVSEALEKGVIHAVKRAEAESPYLIDELHDELADHYYEKLIQSGQLAPE